VPHVGWVLVALADRDVRVLVLGVPAGLVALASAVELLRALREGRRGRDRRARAEQVLAPSSVAPATP
jgi:signal peptidase